MKVFVFTNWKTSMTSLPKDAIYRSVNVFWNHIHSGGKRKKGMNESLDPGLHRKQWSQIIK